MVSQNDRKQVIERTIAIGDIHGCSAALAAVIQAIEPTPVDTLVFLGDYIDRGPDSRGVLVQVVAVVVQYVVVPLRRDQGRCCLRA
jgi:serine/threonine protein phosphatase 1